MSSRRSALDFHVLGNSHVMYLAGRMLAADEEMNIDVGSVSFSIFKAGNTGATVYSLPNKDSATEAGTKFQRYLINRDKVQNVVLMLGDVDIREHIVKNYPGSLFDGLKRVVDIYDGYIADKITSRAERVFVMGCIPMSRKFFAAKYDQDKGNIALPYLVAEYNRLLKERCNEKKWIYFGLHDEITDDCGFVADEYMANPGSSDNIHLNPKLVRPIIVRKLLEGLCGSR